MTAPAPGLHLYDLAFLAGGAERIVDTAVVALVESGRIRVHAPGELAVAESARRHPVEAAVMDAVGTHGHRSIDTVRWRLADDTRLDDVARSLAAAGLLKSRAGLHRRSRPAKWTTTPSGREALLRFTAATPALGGGSAIQVAVHGREAMADAALRASIFEHPLPQLDPGARAYTRRRLREELYGDPAAAAHSGRNSMGGGAAAGFGGGDGGGDGGGGG